MSESPCRPPRASPGRANADLNIRPGSTMAMYWWAVITLVATMEEVSEATMAPFDFAFSMIGVISRSSTPTFSLAKRRRPKPAPVHAS